MIGFRVVTEGREVLVRCAAPTAEAENQVVGSLLASKLLVRFLCSLLRIALRCVFEDSRSEFLQALIERDQEAGLPLPGAQVFKEFLARSNPFAALLALWIAVLYCGQVTGGGRPGGGRLICYSGLHKIKPAPGSKGLTYTGVMPDGASLAFASFLWWR